MKNETVSARTFRYVRRKFMLTQAGMADLLAVNQSTISKIEKGVHQPKNKLVIRLESYTRQSFRELVLLSKQSNP